MRRGTEGVGNREVSFGSEKSKIEINQKFENSVEVLSGLGWCCRSDLDATDSDNRPEIHGHSSSAVGV